mmetsp:Transcript_12981/g.42497  ORF Transcript_12981/g.42497 Transcript_12981/m.42497 type:complete len:210 (-) Transcript_12981:804-1433(-)
MWATAYTGFRDASPRPFAPTSQSSAGLTPSTCARATRTAWTSGSCSRSFRAPRPDPRSLLRDWLSTRRSRLRSYARLPSWVSLARPSACRSSGSTAQAHLRSGRPLAAPTSRSCPRRSMASAPAPRRRPGLLRSPRAGDCSSPFFSCRLWPRASSPREGVWSLVACLFCRGRPFCVRRWAFSRTRRRSSPSRWSRGSRTSRASMCQMTR